MELNNNTLTELHNQTVIKSVKDCQLLGFSNTDGVRWGNLPKIEIVNLEVNVSYYHAKKWVTFNSIEEAKKYVEEKLLEKTYNNVLITWFKTNGHSYIALLHDKYNSKNSDSITYSSEIKMTNLEQLRNKPIEVTTYKINYNCSYWESLTKPLTGLQLLKFKFIHSLLELKFYLRSLLQK